jgi:hypothetical protein
MQISEFRESLSGKNIPYVRNEAGALVPVHAAPLPGASVAFLCAPEREVGAFGNRGGAKTRTLILDFLSGVGRGWGSHWSGIIFREKMAAMRDIIKECDELIYPVWPNTGYNSLKFTYTFRSGETLELRPIGDGNSISAFADLQGRNLSFLAFEELSLLDSLDPYLLAFSSLRSAGPKEMPRKMRCTANPLGPSSAAVAHRFHLQGIPKGIAGPRIEEEGQVARRAIYFDFAENVVMRRAEPDYLATLTTSCKGDEARLESWVKGNWSSIVGGAFDNIFFKHEDRIKVPRFEVPFSWRMFGAFDFGSTSPFCYLVLAESDGCDIVFANGERRSTRKGDIFVVGEVYGSVPGRWDTGLKLPISEIVKVIQQYKIARGWRYRDPLTGKWRDRVSTGVADSSIFDKNVAEFSVAHELEKPVEFNGETHPGLSFDPAHKPPGSRSSGYLLMCEKLGATAVPREGPGLFIVADDCPATIATLPLLQRDDKNRDSVADSRIDHAFDALRYGCTWQPRVIRSYRI